VLSNHRVLGKHVDVLVASLPPEQLALVEDFIEFVARPTKLLPILAH
jgi:hypothetical protein